MAIETLTNGAKVCYQNTIGYCKVSHCPGEGGTRQNVSASHDLVSGDQDYNSY